MMDDDCIRVGPPLPYLPPGPHEDLEKLRNSLALMSVALFQIVDDINSVISQTKVTREWRCGKSGAWLSSEAIDRAARTLTTARDRISNESETLRREGQKNNKNGVKK